MKLVKTFNPWDRNIEQKVVETWIHVNEKSPWGKIRLSRLTNRKRLMEGLKLKWGNSDENFL